MLFYIHVHIAAGLEVLRAAIADPAISRVTVLSRRPLPVSIPTSPKAHVITHEDFSSYPADLISKVADHDACIWALGKSSNGMSETDYTQLTHDWPMAAITALKDGGVGSAEKPFRFVYFSGEGADQTEKSMAMFGRIKVRRCHLFHVVRCNLLLTFDLTFREEPRKTSSHMRMHLAS